MSISILVLGANGFIGSKLCETILSTTDWTIYALDLVSNNLSKCENHIRFFFKQGDMLAESEWIRKTIEQVDAVLPLAAIASPRIYVEDPLRVFALDFEANLAVIKECVRANKRVIFPSTSEVYGMCHDDSFDEETSSLVLGPINKQRWIYSCSKQLLDRVIYAHGVRDNFDYTLFRPFNWTGAGLDNFKMAENGTARLLTQMLYDILVHQKITLVDGGDQRRCFTDIDDGIDALIRIIRNENECATQKIFNIGNPTNDYSIKDVAHMVLNIVSEFPDFAHLAKATQIVNVSSKDHYGDHYQDVSRRVPSIKKAKEFLDWAPSVGMEELLRKTIGHHLNEKVA